MQRDRQHHWEQGSVPEIHVSTLSGSLERRCCTFLNTLAHSLCVSVCVSVCVYDCVFVYVCAGSMNIALGQLDLNGLMRVMTMRHDDERVLYSWTVRTGICGQFPAAKPG